METQTLGANMKILSLVHVSYAVLTNELISWDAKVRKVCIERVRRKK